jgi:DNA-binding protein HU-beta
VAVNKGELVDQVATLGGLDKRTAENAVNAFTQAVMDATTAGDRVAILGFGTFNPTSRAARTGRNPQTGAPVKIAASKSVRFSPGSQFKSVLNTKGGAKKAAKKAPKAKKAAKTSKKR